jgi:hypothetical protein
MMFYSADKLAKLATGYSDVGKKYEALLLAYHNRAYRTERGEEFAMHGFVRRLGTMRHCIETVFDRLPPEIADIPQKHMLEDAIVALQAFIFNVFGCADNLAWVWACEKPVTKEDGTALPATWIGLGSKYEALRASFSQAFRDYLGTLQDWFAHLENYRHALAHRIPLYIPPFRVHPANTGAFRELEQQIAKASNQQDAAQLKAQLLPLKSFYPWMIHSFGEHADPIVVHPQMLGDFHVIEELGWRVLSELTALEAP